MQGIVFQRIVLPTDGSERETWAIDEAIRLAKAMRVGILAVHVLHESTVASAFKGVGTVLQGYERQLLAAAQAAVDRVEALAASQGVKVEKLVLRGSAPEKIAEAAQKGDLLIMPTKGLAGVRGARLGSVTARVVEIAQCPVLVYRATG